MFSFVFIRFTGFSVFVDYFPITKQLIMSSTQVLLNIVFQINLDSPRDETYNFSKGDNYLIDINASSNRVISYWNFTLIDLKHNIILNDSSPLDLNMTVTAARWQNEITISAVDIAGNRKNETVRFYVNIPNSTPVIENISANLYVCENDYLSYLFNATDIDEDPLSYSMSSLDPFYIDSTTPNLTTTTFEIFSGILDKNKARDVNAGYKAYPETITVNDGTLIAQKSTNITVIEINNAPVLENIGVNTVWTRGENASFYYKISVNDTEDGNPDLGNLSINISFFGNENLFNISNNGIMNFTPNSSQLGTYDIIVCVKDTGIRNPHPGILGNCSQDGKNISVCDIFSLTVTSENRPPVILNWIPKNLSLNVSEGERILFFVDFYDPDGTVADSYWYVDSVFKKYSSNLIYSTFFDYNFSDIIPQNVLGYSFSYFYQTFNCSDSGNHSVIVKVTDGILNGSYDHVEWNVNVSDSLECNLCGNSICNDGETCVTCPGDCGVCPENPAGGGGGGGSAKKCIEKWGCFTWSECMFFDRESNKLNENISFAIETACKSALWDNETCGYQIRNCVDVNNCNTNKTIPVSFRECYYTLHPNCTDGIKNCHDESCEQLIDCGGPCQACPSCDDRIKNQGEENVDCGGPCNACTEEKAEKTQGYSENVEKIFLYLTIPISLIALFFIVRLLIVFYLHRKKMKEGYDKRK